LKAHDVTHKNFSLRPQRLGESFEGLSSSLAQSATELCPLNWGWNNAGFEGVNSIRNMD